jgi:putative transposase
MPQAPEGPGYVALRRGRVSTQGRIYLVTFVTHQRRRWFVDDDLARVACTALTGPAAWHRSSLLAWVLMPDHWHGVVELGCGESLAGLMNRIKSNSAREVRRASDAVTRVWADGFHDRAMRSDENLLAAARYVVLNPFRAGLVRRIRDYPYWDAVWVER